MTRRSATRRALVTGVLCGFLVAGCGTVPELPGPMPESVVPTRGAGSLPDETGFLSPDGFDAAQRMAVRVRNVGCEGVIRGTGFAIDERVLITNKHVVEGNQDLQLSTYDGRDVSVTASQSAALADLAVIRTAEDLATYPDLAPTDPEPGDAVTVVGYPNGGALTVTKGTVIEYTSDPLNVTLGQVLLTDASVEPGSSGSAALDSEGKVIGIVYAKSSDGLSYLVPVSTLQDLLADDSGFEAQEPLAC
ncbi:S1C family serine protease [Sanguibacter inulinus]|uniref:Trypsin-like peptidase domain-containing protein n=1 Tax=Sanguibacter inulinus TaxID=60922 RepID=A0A853EV08_9MICO|nr:serine protease [Sanguibacter inulinus]MBF0722469.1 trypsin-like peptidase domain-containing protein [Sanguibacter inulinus]NYS93614.1 trypsin-like peptidase domain-containing protein [Sanguibacter inulinus]